MIKMTGEAESIIVPFLGALQASIAVLLTIAVGVIAAQFNLLSEKSSKDISKFCVRLALPALLIVNVGSQLHLSTVREIRAIGPQMAMLTEDQGIRYVPIIVWALVYNISSMLLGAALTRLFNLPDWVTPAIAFNNTTSLPLLLVQSLAATSILDSIDPSGDAVERAKSYFLVNAMIGNSLTFALGPKLLNGQEEDAPDETEEKEDEEDYENGDLDGHVEAQEEEAVQQNEETSLLPNRVVQGSTRAEQGGYRTGKHYWHRLPSWAKTTLDFLYQFVNPPVIGALLGALVGLVPALHRLFFNEQEAGGYFNAWLTSAIKNVGDLFAALQVIVVGVKLSQSLLRMKKGESNGNVPWVPMLLVTFIRFVLWPVISIAVVYLLAKKTNVLADDPLLW